MLYWQKEAKDLEEERDSIVIEEEDSLKNYYDLLQQYKSLKKDVRDILFSPRYCLPFLQASRLVCIQCYKSEGASPSFSIKDEVTWGVILNFERVKTVSEGENYQWFLMKQVHLPSILVQWMLIFQCVFQMMQIGSQKMQTTQWMFLQDVWWAKMELGKKPLRLFHLKSLGNLLLFLFLYLRQAKSLSSFVLYNFNFLAYSIHWKLHCDFFWAFWLYYI